MRLDDRDATRAGGDSGPAIAPGRPDESLLIRAIERKDEGEVEPMPPKGKLPDSAIADLRRWIERGSFDPRETPGASRDSSAADR